MLARIAAFAALLPIVAVASAATLPSTADYERPSAKAEALSSTAPWWEKLVVTIGEAGDAQTCLYQTSLEPGTSAECSVGDEEADAANAVGEAGVAMPEQMTHITFERRFSPSASMTDGEVAAGDTLLGKSVLALAIDMDGRVRGCKVVATGGAKPDYSCKEATAEKFEASASVAANPLRVATLTILVYAHDEDYV